jgi:hypothetical protein
MKTIFLLLFVYSFACGQKKENGKLIFEGIYETKCEFIDDDKEGEKAFLRFYSNHKVLSVGTECDATANDLKSWFNMGMENKSIGDYKVKGCRIKFSTTSPTGTVKYCGRITSQGILKLKSKSLINGNRSREEYQLVEVQGLQ